MKDVFKKVYRVSLISSIMFLIFGLLLIFQTDSVIKTISIFIGIILLLIGIFPIVNYFRDRNQNFLSNAGLLYGIFSVVAGILLIINNKFLATIIPILTGVWMIINSVNKIQLSMELRDQKISKWFISFIFSIIILICGALLIINPFSSAVLLSKSIGIVIVLYSIIDIGDCIFIKVNVRENMSQKIVIVDEKKDDQ